MYQLPTNFTGNKQTKSQDFKEFEILCYSLQGLGLVKVNSTFDPNSFMSNYFVAYLSLDSGNSYDTDAFCFYLNCYSVEGGFGVAGVNANAGLNEYFDKPELVKAIANLNSYYKILSKDSLSAPLCEDHLVNLSPHVRSQINRMLPQTIGGVLFSNDLD